MTKFKNNSKVSIGINDTPAKSDFSGAKSEDKGLYKNKVNKLQIDSDSTSLILPVIKESHGAVILDKKRFEMLKKDIDNSKNVAKISNTYKQSYNMF